MEPFDSARVIHLSACSAVHGEFYDVVSAYPKHAKFILRALRACPSGIRNAFLTAGLRYRGLEEDDFVGLPFELLANLVASEWQGSGFRGALMGAPLGPVAYLSALSRTAYLTTSFLFSIRDPKPVGDYRHFEMTAKRILAKLRKQHPDLQKSYEIIFHYDPIHDGFLVRWVTHVRLRLKIFPDAYASFIQERVQNGAPLMLVSCEYPWVQVQLDDSSFLQVGGLGGIAPEVYLARYPVSGDRVVRPESEWGTPPSFSASVRSFAMAQGARYNEVRVSSPSQLSNLCFRVFREFPGASQTEMALDCFTYLQPRWMSHKGIPAYWLPFNTRDAWRDVRDALASLHFQRIYLDLVPSFSPTDDTVPFDKWVSLLSRNAEQVIPVGVSPDHFPSDPYSAYARSLAMRRLWKQKPDAPVSVENVGAFFGAVCASHHTANAGKQAR